MNREPVMVYVGMTDVDGDCPATCVPLAGGTSVNCYMTRELSDTIESHHPAPFWAEWNGISYDLIEPMTREEVHAHQIEEAPF